MEMLEEKGWSLCRQPSPSWPKCHAAKRICEPTGHGAKRKRNCYLSSRTVYTNLYSYFGCTADSFGDSDLCGSLEEKEAFT